MKSELDKFNYALLGQGQFTVDLQMFSPFIAKQIVRPDIELERYLLKKEDPESKALSLQLSTVTGVYYFVRLYRPAGHGLEMLPNDA